MIGQSEYEYLLQFAKIAPVVFVMATIIVFLWRDNRNLVEYVREMERDNLNTLNDLSGLLTNLINTSDKNTEKLDKKIYNEAEKTRDHIGHRIDLLEFRSHNISKHKNEQNE